MSDDEEIIVGKKAHKAKSSVREVMLGKKSKAAARDLLQKKMKDYIHKTSVHRYYHVPTAFKNTMDVLGPTAMHLQKVEPKLFRKLRDEHLKSGKLYEDPDFPATMRSIYPSQKYRKIEWKRPKELSNKPVLFSGGASRFDVQQGELGDCWVLAAVASLSMYPQLFKNVVPEDQTFDENYAGIFHFRFWQFGDWVDLIIDDRLPVDGSGKLMFMHSDSKDEFWSALLEKAYAKLNGCYEWIIGGTQAEAFEDFTGGTAATIDLNPRGMRTHPKLFSEMEQALHRSSLMGASIDVDEDGEIEGILSNGLVVGHAYSVTSAKKVTDDTNLVRMRNPWGDDTEWKGKWADGSSEWKAVSEAKRKELGITFDDDGEFWLPYDDFIENMSKLEICYLTEASLAGALQHHKEISRWEMKLHVGQWKKNVNAGGCRNNKDTFWTNPQFRVDVVDADETDADNRGTLIVSLSQKDMRRQNKEFYTIGYAIYKVDKSEAEGTLGKAFFLRNKMIARSPNFINSRSTCGLHKLEPGEYVIVPSTFDKDEECEFLLRIISEKPYTSHVLDENTSMIDVMQKYKERMKDADPEAEKKNLKAMHDKFQQICGRKNYINAVELQEILNSTLRRKNLKFFNGFNLESCRSMVCLMDDTLNGKVEFEEFIKFWNDLRFWEKCFVKLDANNDGSFTAYELRNALRSCGFSVSNEAFEIVAIRYADPVKGIITFEDFILLLIRLKEALVSYAELEKDTDGKAKISETEYIGQFIYI